MSAVDPMARGVGGGVFGGKGTKYDTINTKFFHLVHTALDINHFRGGLYTFFFFFLLNYF